jgi:hypothetical protein
VGDMADAALWSKQGMADEFGHSIETQYWICRNGDYIAIADMPDNHIQNAARHIFKTYGRDASHAVIDELIRRYLKGFKNGQ